MILFDTNVLIYAFDPASPFHTWARQTLANALATEGAAINPVILCELCVGDREPSTVEARLASIGMNFLDLKIGVAEICAEAFRKHLQARRDSGGGAKMPLPDFFIGAHAEALNLPLATADTDRYRAYFPAVRLLCPTKNS